MNTPVDLSENGGDILKKIHKLCNNFEYNTQDTMLNLLLEYQKEMESLFLKNKKYKFATNRINNFKVCQREGQ